MADHSSLNKVRQMVQDMMAMDQAAEYFEQEAAIHPDRQMISDALQAMHGEQFRVQTWAAGRGGGYSKLALLMGDKVLFESVGQPRTYFTRFITEHLLGWAALLGL